MPLNQLSSDALKSSAKEYIETLEYWLRSVIDTKLSSELGDNYIFATKPNGDYFFNRSIREEIEGNRKRSSEKSKRLIDSSLLSTSVAIITNPELYGLYFKEFFGLNFPFQI